jgi:hypothetical protein
MVVTGAASQMKSSSAAPLRLPGMTSRFVKGRSGAELPISRQSSKHDTAAFRSSGWAGVLASICIRSSGQGPVKRICPRLFGRTTPPYNVQEAAGGLNLALVSALHSGTSTWQVCKSGVSRPGLFPRRRLLASSAAGSKPQLTNRRRKLLGSPDSINDIRSIGKIRILYHPVANSLRAPLSPHFWYLS